MMTRAEKDAIVEDRHGGECHDNIGDAGKIWMGVDGESSGWRGHLWQQSGGQERVMELGAHQEKKRLISSTMEDW